MKVQFDDYASYKLLMTEFKKRGYRVEEYSLNDVSFVRFARPGGGVWETKPHRLAYPMNSLFVAKMSINKSLAYAFAVHNKVPIPATYTYIKGDQLDKAKIKDLLARGSVVVKPEQASLSKGVTLNVKTPDQINKAIPYALEDDRRNQSVIIQEQVNGEEIRFVGLSGRVVAALLRRTARVIGDGESTIAQLVGRENTERRNIAHTLVRYPLLRDIADDVEILQSRQVLAKGEVKELSRSTMIGGGASVYNILSDMHPSYVECAERLIKALGAGFIVADMFIEDYAVPMNSTNVRFNEFNSAPVLKVFYSCRDGNNYDIVPELVDAIDDRIKNQL